MISNVKMQKRMMSKSGLQHLFDSEGDNSLMQAQLPILKG